MSQGLDSIPSPPRRPIVGHLPILMEAESPLHGLEGLAREHGPIFRLVLPSSTPLVLSGHALIAEVCDDARFEKAIGASLEGVRMVAGDGLFTAYNEEPNWKLAHDLLLPAFRLQAMRGHVPAMAEIAGQLVAKWRAAGPDAWIDVAEDTTRLALDTIALTAFGARLDSFKRHDLHPFVAAMARTLTEAMNRAQRPQLLTELMFSRKRQLQQDIAAQHQLIDDIVQERKALLAAGAEAPDDLLTAMLSARHPETGERLSDENVRFQAITFMIAGHETTASTMAYALHELSIQPALLAAAQREATAVLGADLDATPTYEQVNQLKLIRRVFKETLRLHPPAAAFARRAREDTVLGGRYPVAAGELLMVLATRLHLDPSVWGPDPERFDPERFTPEAEQARPPHSFKAFGTGVRACIGAQFATVEATLGLAMILREFDLIPDLEHPPVRDVALAARPKGLRLQLRRRSPEALARDAGPQGTDRPGEAAAPKVEAHGTPLQVLYGSNMGTCRALAHRLVEQASSQGFQAQVRPLDEAVGELPTQGAALLLCSTYNGHPPDNAQAFCAWLREGAPDLSGVRYAVFGGGHRDWAATFQAVPRFIDSALAEAGAERLSPRGEGDAGDDFDGAFQAWMPRALAAVAQAFELDVVDASANEGPAFEIEVSPPQPRNPFVGSFGARPMRVLENRELQRPGPSGVVERSTRHIELALPEGVRYQAGDHLGVIPVNSEALLRRVTGRFEIEPEAVLTLRKRGRRHTHLPMDEPMTARALLESYVELQDLASRRDVQALAEHTACPYTRRALAKLAAPAEPGQPDAYREEVLAKRLSVLDLLERFQAIALPLEVFLAMLPPLRPRYYSISSSPLAHPRSCTITVGVIGGEALSGLGRFEGACSSYLARARVGASVQAFVRDNGSDFRLPVDAALPIVMIGPGTGLAPFRGFLQERAALRARGLDVGQDLLFYGCRHPERDFLYDEELRAMQVEGLLQLHVAFSRVEGAPKVYVQERLVAKAEAVWAAVQGGGRVYVCGDAARMEPAVRAALAQVHTQVTGAPPEAGAAWVEDLRAQGRYLTDVWAAGLASA